MKQAVQKRGKKPLIFIVSFVALLLMIIGILFALILNDPNQPIATGAKTDTGVAKLVKAAVTGAPAQLSSEEMNAILAAKLAKGTQTKIKGVRFTINGDNTVDAYVPVDYKGIRFGVSANLTVAPAAEKQISATINSMKIGRLPVNPAWVLSYGKTVLPKEVGVDGNVLHVNADLLNTYVLENMVGANISSLTVANQNFVVGVSGNIDKLKTYIEQNLKSYIGLLS